MFNAVAENPTPLLLVEDDAILANGLSEYLSKFGYAVRTVSRGADIPLSLHEHAPACILLDCMLPGGMDGFDICKRIRSLANSVPIIFTTARGDLKDKITALELGADDYLAKPFDPRELVARIGALLRRSAIVKSSDSSLLRFESLELDLCRRVARVNGQELELSETEFILLEFMAKHAGEVLNRDDLMHRIRGVCWQYGNRSIDMAVRRLRVRLQDVESEPRFIKTVRGAGYMFLAKPLP